MVVRKGNAKIIRETLKSLLIVTMVIQVTQSNGGVKIVLYDFLVEIRVFYMNSSLRFLRLHLAAEILELLPIVSRK